jgi:hypothetical protein
MKLRRKNRASRQHPLADVEAAIARSERVEPAEPRRIHNPNGGTRSHYRDSSGPDLKPVCKASGRHWDEGDGGLALCGLCPYMWAQRQAGSEGQVA